MVQEEISLKDISYLKLWNPGRRHHEEQFCEIILNKDHWFRRRCPFKIFLIWILWLLLCSEEQNHLRKFCRGYYEEHFEFGPVVREMPLNIKLTILELCQMISASPSIQSVLHCCYILKQLINTCNCTCNFIISHFFFDEKIRLLK